MNIKITADSTCDLPKELLEKYRIRISPLCVVKEDALFTDGVTITPAEIFQHVANGGSLCTTSACNLATYEDLFSHYSPKYDAVIHISLGSGFSSSYRNACAAASEFPNVRVIDSANLSVGQGLVVMKAVKLCEKADDLDSIVAELEAFVPKVEASFILDRLDYMVKGGRCSMVTMLGANLLKLKPCIEVKDGKMVVTKKYRGQYPSCVRSYIQDRLANREDIDPDLLFFVKTEISDESETAAKEAIAQYSDFDTVYSAVAGCTISCHCGPGTMGIMFARK